MTASGKPHQPKAANLPTSRSIADQPVKRLSCENPRALPVEYMIAKGMLEECSNQLFDPQHPPRLAESRPRQPHTHQEHLPSHSQRPRTQF